MNNSKIPGPRTLTFLLVLTAAAILSAAAATLINNSIRSAPLYLFLLFLGCGLPLALGPLRGGLGSLVALFAWITLKRELGTWLTRRCRPRPRRPWTPSRAPAWEPSASRYGPTSMA